MTPNVTKLQSYLQSKGFKANPFGTTNAAEEHDNLPSYFVHVPWFDQLVGNPELPESLLLFAPRGYGKTSHRMEVARIAGNPNPNWGRHALIVVIDDMHVLLEQGIEHVTLNTYIDLIRRKTLEMLARYVKETPGKLEIIRQDEETLSRFAALLHLYAPRQMLPLAIPEHAINHHMHVYQQSRLGPREWLKEELASLVHGANLASVYVLFDGLDESHLTRNDRDGMLRLLSPLLDDPGLLQGCGFAFKLFLPQDVQEPILRGEIGRVDRVNYHSLSWSENDLVKMLSQRLQSFSYDERDAASHVERFQELCDADFNVDVRLAQTAGASPRVMVRLAARMFELHCERYIDAEGLISAETVKSVLDEYIASISQQMKPQRNLGENTQRPANAENPPSPAAEGNTDAAGEAPDGPPKLFFDARGDIWLGDRRLHVKLPKILYVFLKHLWENRHRTVPYEELYSVLWSPAELAELSNPRDNCIKHSRRLRELIEPGQSGSINYIDVQRGVGYVLRNTREEEPS